MNIVTRIFVKRFGDSFDIYRQIVTNSREGGYNVVEYEPIVTVTPNSETLSGKREELPSSCVSSGIPTSPWSGNRRRGIDPAFFMPKW